MRFKNWVGIFQFFLGSIAILIAYVGGWAWLKCLDGVLGLIGLMILGMRK